MERSGLPPEPNPAFAELLRRLRAGEEDAAATLVQQYEPFIRREVRLRLTDPGLVRLFDSADICQSVLKSFFVRVAAGQYELDRPEDLVRLLVRMARNKVASKARQLRSRPADRRRLRGAALQDLELVVDDPSPTQVVQNRDLLREVLRRLPDEERRLAELRAQGRTWQEISTARGGSAEARRKQLTRALDRVLQQLGLDEHLEVRSES
jgi:RNA polymerase sigma-70 factor (ECF subfamily)